MLFGDADAFRGLASEDFQLTAGDYLIGRGTYVGTPGLSWPLEGVALRAPQHG